MSTADERIKRLLDEEERLINRYLETEEPALLETIALVQWGLSAEQQMMGKPEYDPAL